MKDRLAEILRDQEKIVYHNEENDIQINPDALKISVPKEKHKEIEYGADNVLSTLLLALMKTEPIRDNVDLIGLTKYEKDEIKIWFNLHFNF